MEKNCGVLKALRVLGNKWTLLIIYELCATDKRFNELARAINGISPKMLSTQLKILVENGIASKTIFNTNPPKVLYKLTDIGQKLKPIIKELDTWGESFTS